MNYRLVVLTHGDHLADLDRTLEAFVEHVEPVPSSVLLRADRAAFDPAWAISRWVDRIGPTVIDVGDDPGFCRSVKRAWSAAASGALIPDTPLTATELSYDYVFWLEHDFVIDRPVDLRDLAAVLETDSLLAQMALMRNAVNEQEIAAGGLVESRPGEYRRIVQPELREAANYTPFAGPVVQAAATWLEHRSYFTTNPSLMRRGFMQANPWPGHRAECEGLFGIDLVGDGYSFGVWGDGAPWCTHIGQRTGEGY